MPDPTLLFETVHGSRAYGLAREASDTDLKGVVVGPPSWYFGHRGGPEQIELHADHVRFELRKLLRLLVAANPMALELLFTDPADHQVVHPAFRGLLERRDAFLTTRVGQTFGGYALGQLKRIETHRQWLHAPPAAAPTRDAFGLPERTLVSRDQLGALSALEEDGVAPDLSPNFLGMLAREKRYQAAKARWKQFQQWRRTRNPRRSALEKKF